MHKHLSPSYFDCFIYGYGEEKRERQRGAKDWGEKNMKLNKGKKKFISFSPPSLIEAMTKMVIITLHGIRKDKYLYAV